MHFYQINNYQFMIYRFYAVYNKHEMIKISNQTTEKSEVLIINCSNNFAADCNL